MSCNTAQNFCKTNTGQLASTHIEKLGEEWGDLKKNDSFLTKEQWNNFIEDIYEAYSLGEAANGFSYHTSLDIFALYPSNDPNPMDIRAGQGKGKDDGTENIMYAKMYNGAIKKMRFLATNNAGRDVVDSGDTITAELFNDLMDYAKNNFYLNKNQCDECNTEQTCCSESSSCSQSGGCGHCSFSPCIGTQTCNFN